MAEQADKTTNKSSKASKTGSTAEEMPQVWEMIGDNDVLLQVDIRLYNNKGEVFKVKGLNTLAHITDQSMLPEAYRNFEETFHAAIGRPVLASFRKFIGEFVEKESDTKQLLTLPDPSKDQGYISDSGGA
jgi:hypothetical protein